MSSPASRIPQPMVEPTAAGMRNIGI
jgi:hypothetical protein